MHRSSVARLVVAVALTFVCLVPRSAAAFSSRFWMDSTVQSFKSLPWADVNGECCIAYVLGTDQKLWKEDYTWGHPFDGRQWVDNTVIDYQGWDGNVVYVLGSDRKLWREVGNMNNRTLVDATVQDFSILEDGLVYVRGTDQKLWLEYPDGNNRTLVDSGVVKFQLATMPANNVLLIYAQYGDGSLWRVEGSIHSVAPITSTWTFEQVDTNVAAFAPIDVATVYVLDGSGNLWNETRNFNDRIWVDGLVEAFIPINKGEVLVQGTDAKLWREFGTKWSRDLVDQTVFIDSADPHAPHFVARPGVVPIPYLVMGYDRKVWVEEMATDNAPCVMQGTNVGSGACCPGLQANQVGVCMPADPAGCGVTEIGGAPPCCKNSTPCSGSGTCVVDHSVSPPYAYCTPLGTGNPPNPPPTTMQTGGGICTPQRCFAVCPSISPDFCFTFGFYCSEDLATAAVRDAQQDDECQTCCGATDCTNLSNPVAQVCQNEVYFGK
jgi:hypothetical protein